MTPINLDTHQKRTAPAKTPEAHRFGAKFDKCKFTIRLIVENALSGMRMKNPKDPLNPLIIII